MKGIVFYSFLFTFLIQQNHNGLMQFYFPDYLHKKIIKQINKSFQVAKFETQPIEQDLMINSEVFSIYGSDNEHLGYGIVTLANGCKLGGCINPGDIDPETEHEQFYFSVLYDKSGHIKGVKVLEYTSQYGYEITAKSWLKQFIGYKAGQLRVGKEIDGISGATISVHSIVNSLNIQQKLLKDTLVSN